MEWEDFYTPVDFYGQASYQAKRFAKKNPDADRELIYLAASDAAERYERSEKLRTSFPFRTWCHLRMRTTVYIAERKESENMTDKLKAAIIADYEAGMKAREIAEKYALNLRTLRTLRNNIGRWKKSGAIRAGKAAEAEEKTGSPAFGNENGIAAFALKEKSAPPAEASEGTKRSCYDESIPQTGENVKPRDLNYVAAAEALRRFADDYFRSCFGNIESVSVHAYKSVVYTLRAGGRMYNISIVEEDK